MGGLDRFFDIGGKDGPQQVTDRILTVPNLLSIARILVLPIVYLDLVGGRYVRALVLLVVFASTDWLDGYVARRFDQVSRLGKLLDPISDRALFVVVGIGFVVADIVPLWVILVLIVRDVLVMGGGALLLVTGGSPPDVTRIGKTATFGLMLAFPLFLGAVILGEGPRQPEPILHAIAWVTYVVHAVLYWVSAGQYVVQVRNTRRSD